MEIGKPVSSNYLINDSHKQKQIRKVKLLMRTYEWNRQYLFDGNWNHKKTNAKKALYSCGGYGGKCAGCKRSCWNRQKARSNVYEFQGEERYFN